MKNATRAFLLLVCISFAYLGCTPEETPVTEVQAPTPTQTVPPTIESFSPQSAFAGEQVTINGTGFGQLPIGIQVFFGDVEAQVVSASSTKIVVIVPEGAEEEKIQVKAEGGQAFTGEAFTVFDFDMYVVGSQLGVGSRIWKNNILQEAMIDFSSNSFLTGIQIVENDIYVLGTNNNQIGVWKNQEPLPIEYGTPINTFSSDFFFENGEMTIAGNTGNRGLLWRGNEGEPLIPFFNAGDNSIVNSLTKNNGITLVAGRNKGKAVVWEDNKLFSLPNKEGYDDSNAQDIVITNNFNEIIVGTVSSSIAIPEEPAIWINRELNILPFPNDFIDMKITAVAADDNENYYVVGHGFRNGSYKACIWKNGVFSVLSDAGVSSSFAFDVTVFRDDVFVAGRIGSPAVVWINGEPAYLSTGQANAIAITEK